MITIYKYELPVESEFKIVSYKEFNTLSVQLQGNVFTVWATVDTESGPKVYDFYCYGTGHEITEDLHELVYVGTVQNIGYVFHYFYKDY